MPGAHGAGLPRPGLPSGSVPARQDVLTEPHRPGAGVPSVGLPLSAPRLQRGLTRAPQLQRRLPPRASSSGCTPTSTCHDGLADQLPAAFLSTVCLLPLCACGSHPGAAHRLFPLCACGSHPGFWEDGDGAVGKRHSSLQPKREFELQRLISPRDRQQQKDEHSEKNQRRRITKKKQRKRRISEEKRRPLPQPLLAARQCAKPPASRPGGGCGSPKRHSRDTGGRFQITRYWFTEQRIARNREAYQPGVSTRIPPPPLTLHPSREAPSRQSRSAPAARPPDGDRNDPALSTRAERFHPAKTASSAQRELSADHPPARPITIATTRRGHSGPRGTAKKLPERGHS
ncbi:uncharacterized protein [Dipodomys merriami]|uniref:uncharacterized protein n=1 Tax=Dipodomys merriami TaxID=94247 RepID=UPI0038556A5F